VANARAYAEKKKRAEALAELDRAKTAFFSTVAHEFRTPLTLMLGPVEEGLTTLTEALALVEGAGAVVLLPAKRAFFQRSQPCCRFCSARSP
jgi:signal transduction histidine kinase